MRGSHEEKGTDSYVPMHPVDNTCIERQTREGRVEYRFGGSRADGVWQVYESDEERMQIEAQQHV